MQTSRGVLAHEYNLLLRHRLRPRIPANAVVWPPLSITTTLSRLKDCGYGQSRRPGLVDFYHVQCVTTFCCSANLGYLADSSGVITSDLQHHGAVPTNNLLTVKTVLRASLNSKMITKKTTMRQKVNMERAMVVGSRFLKCTFM